MHGLGNTLYTNIIRHVINVHKRTKYLIYDDTTFHSWQGISEMLSSGYIRLYSYIKPQFKLARINSDYCTQLKIDLLKPSTLIRLFIIYKVAIMLYTIALVFILLIIWRKKGSCFVIPLLKKGPKHLKVLFSTVPNS